MTSTQPHTQCIPHAPHSVPAQSQPRVSWPKYAKQQDVLSGRQWWPHRSLMFRPEGPAPTQGRPADVRPTMLLLCGGKLPCTLSLGGAADVLLGALDELLWWTNPRAHQGWASEGSHVPGKAQALGSAHHPSVLSLTHSRTAPSGSSWLLVTLPTQGLPSLERNERC